MSTSDPETLARIHGLLQVTRAVHGGRPLQDVLDGVARTLAETLGYRAVVLNIYRPAWNDFEVATVHDYNEDARRMLLGSVGDWEGWAPLLDERFQRRGAYFVQAGEFDWSDDLLSHTPDIAVSDDPSDWHPDDALFVPLRHTRGHLLGIISVDEPLSGKRPRGDDLDVLVAFAEHAALALESAQEAEEAARHRAALEQLLAVSSRMTERLSTDAVLTAVCEGIARALGFEKVTIDLPDPASGIFESRSNHGWSLEELRRNDPLSEERIRRLLEPRFEQEGCFLLTEDEALERLPDRHEVYLSVNNGLGELAWNRHWLLVPLLDRAGGLMGVIWVDDPIDRMLPSRQAMQALRVFANQAAATLDATRHFEEVRYLAEHDTLTTLPNRRAFTRRLAVETARSGRYHRPFALVLCDLDGFKELNDRFGHGAGDDALREVGRLLSRSVRRSDVAFRVGGDEFALILPETEEAEVRAAVDRIAVDLESAATASPIKASFGVSVFPRDGQEPERLFRAADDAMYSAKRCGERLHFAA
jgi:diguanylate cyclase (GGDEF)-like protein